MPPLHRSFSFQVSEAFNEVLKKTDTKTQKYEFNYEGINNFKMIDMPFYNCNKLEVTVYRLVCGFCIGKLSRKLLIKYWSA